MDSIIYFFFFFSSIVALALIYLLFTTHIVRAAFAFLVVLLGVAALFILANAEFVAMVQLLIYIGGILVLLIFGVMLTTSYTKATEDLKWSNKIVLLCFCCFLGYALIFCLQGLDFEKVYQLHIDTTTIPYIQFSLTQLIGYLLMTEYILPFEMVGFLLLISLMGAALVSGNKNKISI
jgi:NADH:ubiquinone oxidoreductase subunit 6 (subunit J)